MHMHLNILTYIYVYSFMPELAAAVDVAALLALIRLRPIPTSIYLFLVDV